LGHDAFAAKPDAVGLTVAPNGLEAAMAAMKREGLTDDDIATMMRKNPARFLGLD
jgi:predicted metal-dependent phosphotriesterase family hydrolase